ncbi:MAG: hypothetical protein ACRC20_16710 [Segniliparus sp.]|uniref:hypothetical protein n=1 Tax=Segniliparus sp. TaxID=2804064 RepID=UPI003F379025
MRFQRSAVPGAALLLSVFGGAVPPAVAVPEQTAPDCALLDQMSAALQNEVGPGVGGLRSVLKQPYGLFEVQQNDANTKMDILEGGAAHLRDLDRGGAVPGLAPLLGQLDAAAADIRTSTDDIFYFRVMNKFSQIEVLSRRPLRPAYWAKLDHADELSDQIDGVLGNARSRGCS